MNRKIVLLNLVLVALAAALVWQWRVRWMSAASHEHNVLTRPAAAVKPIPPPALETPRPASPAEYVDVAQKTLFARDRNPNVVVELPPPPPPPKEKPMPPLPFYHGQMALTATPVVLLSLKGDDQKGYHEGDEVGPFKLISFDRESVTFEWDGKTVERKFAEMKPKEAAPAQAAAPSAGPAPSSAATVVKPLSSSSPTGAVSSNTPQMGNDMGNGSRGCAAGDNTPAGTVVDGYKKVMVRTLMSTTCYWEQSK